MELNPNYISQNLSILQNLSSFETNLDEALEKLYADRNALVDISVLLEDLHDLDEIDNGQAAIAEFNDMYEHFTPIDASFAYTTRSEEKAIGHSIRYVARTVESTTGNRIELCRQLPGQNNLEIISIIVVPPTSTTVQFFYQDIDEWLTPSGAGMDIYSFEHVTQALKETIALNEISSTAIDLFKEGKYSPTNMRATLAANAGYGCAYYEELLAPMLLASNVGDNPLSMLTMVQSYYGGYTKASSSANVEFEFPIDTHTVGTSYFIGVDTIIQIAGTVLSAIAYLINPIAGMVTSAVTAVAGIISEAITENTADYPIYPDNPTFTGFGQNVTRTYAQLTGPLKKMVTKDMPYAMLVSPILTGISYNAPQVGSDGVTRYPLQEFIIPVLPTAPEGWSHVVDIFKTTYGDAWSCEPHYATGGAKTRSWSATWEVVGTSSVDFRYKALRSYMQWLNANPDKVYIPGPNDPDYEYALKLAIWVNYLMLLLGTTPIADEYTSLSYTLPSFSWGMYASDGTSTRNGQLSSRTVALLSALGQYMWNALVDHPWDGSVPFSQYLVSLENYPYMEGDEPYKDIYDLDLEFKWSELVNEFMLTSLDRNFSERYDSNFPCSVQTMITTAGMNPSIIPPAQDVNIWIRVALTVGVVAAVTISAMIVKSKLKKKAVLKFAKYAETANDAYRRYTETGSNEDYRAWRKATRKGNTIGKLFGLGSIDSVNNWVNQPSSHPIINNPNDVSAQYMELIRLIGGKVS